MKLEYNYVKFKNKIKLKKKNETWDNKHNCPRSDFKR